MLLGRLERHRVRLLGKHHDQLIAEGLAQFQPQIEGDKVVADQCFLSAGHLHHADQAEQQP